MPSTHDASREGSPPVSPQVDPLYERQELVSKRQIQNTARWPLRQPGQSPTERVLPAQQPRAQPKTWTLSEPPTAAAHQGEAPARTCVRHFRRSRLRYFTAVLPGPGCSNFASDLGSSGDSNRRHPACKQQAARPPTSITAGYRPGACIRVLPGPYLLRYFPCCTHHLGPATTQTPRGAAGDSPVRPTVGPSWIQDCHGSCGARDSPPPNLPLLLDMEVIVRRQDQEALRLDHLHDQALCRDECVVLFRSVLYIM